MYYTRQELGALPVCKDASVRATKYHNNVGFHWGNDLSVPQP